ncbi:sigma-54 interaction domain-containing protein [Paraclostridium sordellii]|uniref:sigma-54 interaction domain-containing protein n=1 Tax=Paraclostridium sordellii TaxID=1505 RepID=UPI0003869236|nr:sigma 54-interacting transcriptional regulator [Paeniclostridium sordellii]EPZ55980.1 AAA domain family protein [[Clostridium] sordellii VPI 9048] [Paeniclostridium sordellii VPI 9048]CEK33725.1 sigma-54 dependent transcriptional regulator,Propionate catabolism operon regulatory protein,propionate catabolism operon regulatory protein PrpR,Transcriptional regulator containing PAS, AAA-type ATPase, and DNA-binding domains,propionate catabolism operon regulatory protein PrpR,Sigma-54 interaction 
MKKITIISLGKETGKSLKIQLESILEKNIIIYYFSIDDKNLDLSDSDLIVFSSADVANLFFSKNNIFKKYIIVKRVIQHELLDKLFTLKKGTNVLLVNDTKHTCEVAIKQLIAHGVDHLIYHPYYPGIDSYEIQRIAITPGEEEFVPTGVSEIINIGTREIDIVSIMEIIMYLDDLEIYQDLLSSYFYRKIVTQYKKYVNISNKSIKLTRILKDIIDNSEEGIIYVNTKNEVLVYNKVSMKILGFSEDITGKNIYDMFPNINNELTLINDNEIFISNKKIYSKNELMGYTIILETSSIIDKLDEERRRKKKQNVNSARYTFEDMIGNNQRVLKMINLSKKISKSNSTVLIQGESGTGKEILAQAIHNESTRKNNKFIAINFSALSENLLESELFGYEEGAFTGAKKGGKIGLFKKAHKGTIFLDEIGDAPYHFQTRLLRVLQEREITPVGSCDPIPIDVRVIAATNKDLLEEVKANRFREDLFYRINVMPLYTISLRDRKDDIELLIKYYLRKHKVFTPINKFLDEKVIDYLKEYNWPGNIRELVNIVEFLVNIKEDKTKIKFEDLPLYMLKNLVHKESTTNSNMRIEEGNKNNKFKMTLSDNEIWVLNKIYLNDGIGRRALCKISKEECLDLGEGQIRGILNKLKESEYIEVNKGIKGTKISEKGINLINKGI